MTRDIAGLGRKKQSKTPRAEALATSFTEKFQIPGELRVSSSTPLRK